MKKFLLFAYIISLAALSAAEPAPKAAAPLDPYDKETREERDARMGWWRDAKFGLFIHWGVYAVPAGTYNGKKIKRVGEWIMYHGKIPVAEYKAFAKDFQPVQYDPEFWAKLAKKAGMRYMVITAKHHDGFALFPSAVSEWDIADATPYGKDLIGPLADAARKEGLKFGLYYSQAQDWIHPGGAKSRFEEPQGWDPAQAGSMDSYLETIAVPQVEEILTRYQPDILWWDTPIWMNQERADRLIPLLGLVPGIIHNDRLGGDYQGDTVTPEQHIPATGFPDRDWEVCMTMNDTWGFKSYDENWKSTETLIQKLCDIVSKGGNFLLNIGPKADGTIPQASIDRLTEIGQWMAANGESIYGTTASPFGLFPWGRSTVKLREDGATVYLHVFDWPADGKLRVPGFGSEPKSIQLLATGEQLNYDRFAAGEGKGISVHLPSSAPDPHASVIRIEVSGASDFEEILPAQLPDGNLILTPRMADLHSSHGGSLEIETIAGIDNIKNWNHHTAWVGWRFRVTKPGVFQLQTEVAAEKDAKLTAQVNGGEKLEVAIAGMGEEPAFVPIKLGRLEVETPGVYELQIRPVGKDSWNPIRLRTVEMIPEDSTAPGTL